MPAAIEQDATRIFFFFLKVGKKIRFSFKKTWKCDYARLPCLLRGNDTPNFF
jgi:hypothetical protein